MQQVQEVLHELHSTTDDIEDKMAEIMDEVYLDRLVTYLKYHSIEFGNTEKLREILKAAHLYVMDLPVMTLEVAFRPRQSFVDELRRWLIDHGPGPLRFELEVDPEMVGGVRVSWEGKVESYTLAEKISDAYINEKL